MKLYAWLIIPFLLCSCASIKEDKLEVACDDHQAEACQQIGMKYYQGNGVELSYPTAKHYWEKACALDSSEACMDLGEMYANGMGVDQSVAKARNYYEMGCELGLTEACDKFNSLRQVD
ncbi:MAG: sel1 repeat family protein [Burkholderiales bacterium]|nr:sel1 repeat family protein [Burkholderiales bacterium]